MFSRLKKCGACGTRPILFCFSVFLFWLSLGTSIFDARLGLAEEEAEAWQRHAAQRPTKANPAWREKRRSYKRLAASSANSDLSPLIIVTCPEIACSLNFSTT
jgi:hypothetical protein